MVGSTVPAGLEGANPKGVVAALVEVLATFSQAAGDGAEIRSTFPKGERGGGVERGKKMEKFKQNESKYCK